jgi:hypothetical protein
MIKIDENWNIETDSYCFKLIHTFKSGNIRKNGEEITGRDETYHPTLRKCLLWYCNEVTKDCDDIKAVIKKIDELNAKIESL